MSCPRRYHRKKWKQMIQKKISRTAKTRIAAWIVFACLSMVYPGRAVCILILLMLSFRGPGWFRNGIFPAILLEGFLILGRMLSGSDALSFPSFLINAILGLLSGGGVHRHCRKPRIAARDPNAAKEQAFRRITGKWQPPIIERL